MGPREFRDSDMSQQSMILVERSPVPEEPVVEARHWSSADGRELSMKGMTSTCTMIVSRGAIPSGK